MKCCECGRFVGYGADSSTPYSGPTAEEPDDPDFYCDRCAARLEEYYVAQGWVPSDWCKAQWQRRAGARLGLVEITQPGAAWTVWAHPDRVPQGFVFASGPTATRPWAARAQGA